MSFNWEDYLTLANELSTQNEGYIEQARKRAAISRAYYAAFIKARNKALPEIGRPPSNYRGGSHNYYINYYVSKGHAGREVHRKLKRLKKRRVKADYEDSFNSINKELISALRESKKIISKLDQIIL